MQGGVGVNRRDGLRSLVALTLFLASCASVDEGRKIQLPPPEPEPAADAQKDLDASLFANRNPRDGARGGAPGLSKEASNALKGASKLLGGATDQLDRLKGDSAATDAASSSPCSRRPPSPGSVTTTVCCHWLVS